MSDTKAGSAVEAPRPSVREMQELLGATVSRPSRPAYLLLLAASVVVVAIAAALLATEPALPSRTRIAFSMMIAIGLSWIAFSAWVLARRTVLLGRQRLIAARIAVACTSLFTIEAWVIGRSRTGGSVRYAAFATGIVLVCVAVGMLVRANRRFKALLERRAALERQLRGVGTTALLAVLLVAHRSVPAESQADLALKPGSLVVGGQPIAVTEGRLTVTANRMAGSDGRLSLAFFQIKSTAAVPGSPIVFLAGGPGDAGSRAIAGMPKDLLDELRSVADVIAFDQRGTGLSEPRNPTCPPGPMLSTTSAGNPSEFLNILRDRVSRCIANATRAGVDVGGLTTAESADDLDDLRRSIGAAKLSLLAGSYGTHLALAMAKRHPQSVDRMVLAGVEGLDDTFKLPARVDDVLATIEKTKRPTLIADVRALRERLARENAHFTFPAGQVITLGEWDLQRWIAESLDAVPKIDAMTAAVAAMLSDNDFGVLARWALAYRVPKPLNLMNLAMDCASYGSPDRLALIRRQAATAILGDAINFPLPGLCDVPGLPRLPESYRAAWSSDVPALLISGGIDGRTPVQNAIDVGRMMPRASTLIIDGASHGLFREPAVTSALLAYFRRTDLAKN